MKKEPQNVEEYVEIIFKDEREKIVSETPTEFSKDKIERIYEFEDGAIIKYEWQSLEIAGNAAKEQFNHRFTLINLPVSNAKNFKKGIIREINYPS